MNINPSFNLSIAIGVIIIGLAIAVYIQYKEQKYKPNYRLFFIFGMTWFPLGIVFYKTTRNIGFLVMGLIFLIIGLANKDKWKEPQPVTSQKNKILISLVILTGLLVLATFLLKYLK